ncbi:pentatricopeptide repeat-containing protein At5g61370, mitochondrial [Silene latifolia]|uniref:pentatricopeptide repeat-containing protein At5g61370, mitochondrial n=1 Tax=Silene latifolia TaxID=37657 RepID=UPI003D76B9F5
MMMKIFNAHRLKTLSFRRYNTLTTAQGPPQLSLPSLEKLCSLVSTPIGGLDELESKLGQSGVHLTPSTVVQVVNHCKDEASTRRLLRFFTWSCKNLGSTLGDKEFNDTIRVFAEKKDHRAVDILLSDLRKDGRALDVRTFISVAETLVKLGREDDALGIFKNLALFKCPQDGTTVSAIVSALCSKGHARRAEGVLYHHRDKLSGIESCVYRSILYGWSLQTNVKEARKVIQQMKQKDITLDLFCFNTYLRCLCEKNLKKNPSGLVPESLNVLMEMRTYKILPNSVSYNILLSCLGRTRRVKESLRIFDSMKRAGCRPDWVSYYLLIRVLYLSGRFGKGNQMLDMMIEEGLVPPEKFYYDLVGVLCGVERVNFALQLLDHMKKTLACGYGPVYDVLIPKLCSNGDFKKGRRLWEEAEEMGIALQCSSDVLDPSITKVFELREREKDVKVEDSTKKDTRKSNQVGITRKPRNFNKKKQKRKAKKKVSST